MVKLHVRLISPPHHPVTLQELNLIQGEWGLRIWKPPRVACRLARLQLIPLDARQPIENLPLRSHRNVGKRRFQHGFVDELARLLACDRTQKSPESFLVLKATIRLLGGSLVGLLAQRPNDGANLLRLALSRVPVCPNHQFQQRDQGDLLVFRQVLQLERHSRIIDRRAAGGKPPCDRAPRTPRVANLFRGCSTCAPTGGRGAAECGVRPVSSASVDSDRDRSPELATPEARVGHLRLKRWIDLCFGSLVLVLLSPLLAVIAILIRLDSPGPALFRQTRIGMRRRPFEMWKFRTMVRGAPDDPHRDLVLPLVRGCAGEELAGAESTRRIYKLADDRRITRVGHWLRRTSLDELPQLVNVLRGEMSLVGPRPPVTYEYEAYDAWQLQRFEMPQGMTGLWQVSGRNRVSYRRMCELDIEYVLTWSLWLDLKILAKTVRAVVLDTEPRA